MIDIDSLSLSQPSHSAQLYLQSILKVVDSSIMFNIKRAAYHDSETVTTPFIIKYMRSLYRKAAFCPTKPAPKSETGFREAWRV